eukprot:TRINITY_DN6312_c0_g2_i1.p1 TRINITY_DN6312_c0_g2~~TRINITY_DN6312_c0_g2_i1.p1  ORF type:complete len:776 (+),score=181.63 TRINITY_DN6312_c0_g2_i1:103-2430(+)
MRGSAAVFLAALLGLGRGSAGAVVLRGGFELPPRHLAATPAEQGAAALALAQRLLGNASAAALHLTVVPGDDSGEDQYNVTSRGGRVSISGTSGVALAQGLYWYLREYCNSTVTWGREGSGICVQIPMPPPEGSGSGRSAVPLRYVYNTCTFGYTMAWWDWSRWEAEIDWQALHGVNMPLSFVGQEYVWRALYRELNVTDDELAAHFSSAAYLPWQRMGNLEGWQGPLSDAMIDRRHEVQMRILARQRALGMLPVLPGFAGHVPLGLRRVYPNASYTQSEAWNGFNSTLLLQPADPLFPQIGQRFIELQQKLYGWTSHMYNADTFNEMNPGSSDPDYLRSSAAAVVSGMRAADPHARWVMQAWLFMNGWWTDSNIRNYLDGARNDATLMLDLQSDVAPIYTRTQGYYGKSWIWCMLHNFGGRPGIYGDLNGLATAPLRPLHAQGSTMVGIGLTPEATEQNAVAYELALDAAWLPGVGNVIDWVARWARGRYPSAAARDGAEQVWHRLVAAAYTGREGPPDRRWAMFEVPGPSRVCNIPTLDRSGLVAAWSGLTDLAACMPRDGSGELPPTYRHDLAELTLYAVLLRGCEALDNQTGATQDWNWGSRSDANRAKVSAALASVVATLKDADAAASCDPNLRLACWIADAQVWADGEEDRERIRRAARRQLTLWGPIIGDAAHLVDYAQKPWGGLLQTYYAARWQAYATEASKLMREGRSIGMEGEMTTVLIDWERQFALDEKFPMGPCKAQGDAATVARDMRARYYPELQPHPACRA